MRDTRLVWARCISGTGHLLNAFSRDTFWRQCRRAFGQQHKRLLPNVLCQMRIASNAKCCAVNGPGMSRKQNGKGRLIV